MLAMNLSYVGHIATAFALTFALGFERQIRGSAAGDRTFSLIGVGTSVIGVLAAQGNALTILSGAVTGVGFIGAGLLFRAGDASLPTVHGVTTAAAIVAAGGIGAAAGEGQLWLAFIATVLVILILELRYIPVLRLLDARVWEHHFKDDTDPHHRASVTVTVTATAGADGRPGSEKLAKEAMKTSKAAVKVAQKESALEDATEATVPTPDTAPAPDSTPPAN